MTHEHRGYRFAIVRRRWLASCTEIALPKERDPESPVEPMGTSLIRDVGWFALGPGAYGRCRRKCERVVNRHIRQRAEERASREPAAG